MLVDIATDCGMPETIWLELSVIVRVITAKLDRLQEFGVLVC